VEPDAVRAELAECGDTTPIAELLPLLQAGGVRRVSPNGVLGDPAGASAEEGAAVLAGIVDRLAGAVAGWRIDPTGRLQEAGAPGER
jgi:creatinine amidohydrolase